MNYNVPKNARQEIKFVSSFYNYSIIMAWIKAHRVGFFQEYKNRWVNNIYFDTYDYFSYSSNLSGESKRAKVRYRWYGDKVISIGQLEVKKKRNVFGWKDVYKVSESPYKDKDSWADIKRKIFNNLPSQDARVLKFYNFPVIINRYYRSYYISQDRKIRITVDRDQSVYDQRYKSIPNFYAESKLPKTIVIEVKFDRSDRHIVSELLVGFPVRVSKHSKYMNSVNSVSGRKYI